MGDERGRVRLFSRLFLGRGGENRTVSILESSEIVGTAGAVDEEGIEEGTEVGALGVSREKELESGRGEVEKGREEEETGRGVERESEEEEAVVGAET